MSNGQKTTQEETDMKQKLKKWEISTAVYVWIAVLVFLCLTVICLTCTYKCVVWKWVAQDMDLARQNKELQEKICEQQKKICKLETDLQSVQDGKVLPSPPISSGNATITFESEGEKIKFSKGGHPSTHADPYIQTLFSLTFLCTLFVVAFVVTVLVPLHRILRKHDDYY